MTSSPTSTTVWSRTKRWLWRASLAAAGLVAFYVGFLLLGFIPVNRGYTIPPEDNRVRIFVCSNEIHTDIVMPTVHDALGVDWRTLFPPRDFASDVTADSYVAVGWGNRRFYVETPTWADFKVSTAACALFWPSESVLHVEYLPLARPGPNFREVSVTREQYQKLVRFVRSSVGALGERGCAKTACEITYGPADRFYVASGRYHCFNTCNQWTGRGLAAAGVPVGIWTPLKPQVLCWLRESDGERDAASDAPIIKSP